jgi:hypothetical protein
MTRIHAWTGGLSSIITAPSIAAEQREVRKLGAVLSMLASALFSAARDLLAVSIADFYYSSTGLYLRSIHVWKRRHLETHE